MIKAEPSSFVFVNVKGSSYVFSVVTIAYYEILIQNLSRAPASVYHDNEYTHLPCPFTFSTLTDHLPFKMTPLGRFRLMAEGAPQRDLQLLSFHRECLAIYKQYSLNVSQLWFDYMNDDEIYALAFRKAYERLNSEGSNDLRIPSSVV